MCTIALYRQAGVTGHFSDYFTSSLNLRHSCTCPALCWSLGSISTAIAWEKKVLGCHKFCLSITSIGWLSTGLNHTFLATSALKQYFIERLEDVPMYTLWKHESIPTRIAWDIAERVPRLLRAIGPPPPFSIQSCTQNWPTPKVQSRSGDWIELFYRLNYLNETWYTWKIHRMFFLWQPVWKTGTDSWSNKSSKLTCFRSSRGGVLFNNM